jgi:hypothetical protein
MKDGLYKVEFKTTLGVGTGIIFKDKSAINGGDSGMYYSGTYEEKESGLFEVTVKVGRHSQSETMMSALGIDDATLILSGKTSDRTTVQGYVKEDPSMNFSAILDFIK